MMMNFDFNYLMDRLENEVVGVKGRRNAKELTESIIEEVTGQKHAFDAYRPTYHHYHVVTDPKTLGGKSVFVSFSGSKVKSVSKY